MTGFSRRLRLIPPLAVAFLLSSSATVRGATSMGGSDHVDLELLSERASVRPGEPFEVGLHMKMKKGWHTYWMQPGDAGLPLQVEWTLPAGFSAGPMEWPAPERIPTGELMSYGYAKDVLLTVTITPPARIAGESVTIAGAFDWLECKDVCIADSDSLSVTIPVRPGEARPGRAAPLFAEARARRPRTPMGWRIAATAGARVIELSFRPPRGVAPRGGYFFSAQPLVVSHAAPQGFERDGGGFRLTLVPAENAPSPPRRITGVLVLDGVSRRNGNALAVDVEAAPGNPAPAPAQGKRGGVPVSIVAALLAMVGLALLFLRRRATRA